MLNGDKTLEANIRLGAHFAEELIHISGIMELELSGILPRGDGITPPHWTSLVGKGTIAVSGLKAEAGEE